MTLSHSIRTRRRPALFGASLLALSLAFVSHADAKMPHKTPSIHDQIVAEAQKIADAQKAAYAQDAAAKQAQIDALQTQVQQLAAQLQSVQAKVAVPQPTVAQIATQVTPQVVAALPKPDTTVSMKKGTATIASSDAAFTVAVHGVMQLDAASYSQSDNLPAAITGASRDLNSGTNFRRARIGVGGKLFSDFDYNLLYDFGGGGAEDTGRIQEAWVQYSGFTSAKIRVGAFAPLLGLEDAGSTNAQPFVERPASSDIARGIAGGDTRVGLAVFNGSDRWLYSLAVTGNTISQLNTQATAFTAPNFDEQLSIAARVAGTPLRGFNWLVHVGVNYSAIINPADLGTSAAVRYAVQLRERPELRVDGTRLIDTGAINGQNVAATGFELAGQYSALFAQGEAFQYKVTRLAPATGVTNPTFNGWYVEGGWSLTGEARKYNTATASFDSVTPLANFDPKTNHWGAFEVVARLSNMDLNYHPGSAVVADRVLGGSQNIASLGLDWQLNTDVRFVFEGQGVTINRVNATGVQIGQKYNAYAVRSQFSF